MSSLSRGVIFPITAGNKEVTSLPKPVGRGKIENHQRSARAPGKIEEALGGLLRAKKIKEQSYIGDIEPLVPKESQWANQNTPTIGRELSRTYIEMLQNPFYEGMQRKTKTIIEGHFKETHHLRHGNYIKGQNVRGPHSNTKRRSVTSSKGSPI